MDFVRLAIRWYYCLIAKSGYYRSRYKFEKGAYFLLSMQNYVKASKRANFYSLFCKKKWPHTYLEGRVWALSINNQPTIKNDTKGA